MVTIKDRAVRWFIKSIVMPKQEIMDTPGFIVSKFAEKGSTVYLRELWIPESLLVDVEKEIVKKFGDKGRQALYSAGKRFGWRYGVVAHFANIRMVSKEQLLKNMYLFIEYATCIWAKEYNYEPDVDKKTFEATSENFIICEKNGIGHLMSEGCPGGYFAYLMDDPTLEGTHVQCQGNGNPMCKLIFAPAEVLKSRGVKYIAETKVDDLQIGDRYAGINEIRKPEFAKYSFNDLVNSRVFRQEGNYLMYLDERHFICEESIIDLLEMEIKKIEGGEDVVYGACFEFGKSLGKKMGGKLDSASTYMSAKGWGDILIMKKEGKIRAYSKYFPWTIYSDKLNFIVFSGVISGLISGIENKDIKLKKKSADVNSGYLTVNLEEI